MEWKKISLDWTFCTVSWTVAALMFSTTGLYYRYLYTHIIGLSAGAATSEIHNYMLSGYQYLELLLFGISFGTVFYIVHWLFDNTKLRNKSFGRIILLKSIGYVIGFGISFTLIFFIIDSLSISPFENFDEIKMMFFNMDFLITVGTFLLVFSFIINFMLEVKKKYGPGNLWLMVIGKYHQPKVEERIFMFLDLKDSTTYAEKLGHIKYSQLIQRCFLLLNEIVYKHHAQIYQYVGDEAVLTWTKNEHNAINHSIELYFEFERLLKKKEQKFIDRFGFVPEFKAGINEGKVTAAEVGNIKREIAYHGDVLNTGSRIQDKCNELGKKLLVSEVIAEDLRCNGTFIKESMGEIALKGKQSTINIFAIELA